MRTLIDLLKRAIRRSHRDQIAVWLCNMIMRTVASPWQRDLARLVNEPVPARLRGPIQNVLADYLRRFDDCDAEWPGVDANLEELSWAYRELTGWDADAARGGQP